MDEEMLMDLTGAAEEDTAQAAQLDAQVQEHSTAETNRDAMKLLTELNDTEDIADSYHQDPSYDNMAELVSYIENLYSMAVGLDKFKLAHYREIDQQKEMIQNLIYRVLLGRNRGRSGTLQAALEMLHGCSGNALWRCSWIV